MALVTAQENFVTNITAFINVIIVRVTENSNAILVKGMANSNAITVMVTGQLLAVTAKDKKHLHVVIVVGTGIRHVITAVVQVDKLAIIAAVVDIIHATSVVAKERYKHKFNALTVTAVDK